MPHIVVLSGAGISAESGVKTFRDHNGLWENHPIEEVASPEGFARNPDLVLEFYNRRRAQLNEVKPNAGHHHLVALEATHTVTIITQNVDDLHERAGSSQVIHLHGELRKVRPVDTLTARPWTGDLRLGDVDERGVQLRPHIVWFGENVPLLPKAADEVQKADLLLIIGTSLQVYPAASLVGIAPPAIPVIYIDPRPAISPEFQSRQVTTIAKGGAAGMAEVREMLQQPGFWSAS